MTVNFTVTSRDVVYEGQLVCPSAVGVCADIDCPDSCNFRGRCMNNTDGKLFFAVGG